MATLTAPDPRTATPAATVSTAPARVASIDIIRGAVMVLMAIDHVRVYSAVPAGGPTPGVFFTRWVTHFCAPLFVFLAGTSAFLYAQKRSDKGELTKWLFTRGALLVVLELTILRLAWTFNTDYANYMLGGVIWMIGWCMIMMSLLVRLPLAAIGVFGLAIIFGHNLIGPASDSTLQGSLGWVWKILYYGQGLSIGGGEEPNFFILYTLVPWIGVMAAGYAFGAVMRMAPDRRRRWCLAIGAASIAAFLVLRGFEIYGDRPWTNHPPQMPGYIAFLNTTKYPASLLFLLMTLGPAILLMPALESARGRVAQWLTVFGRVPFFYYLLHIPLIHVVALVIATVRTPDAVPVMFSNFPLAPARPPDGYRWSLGMLYLVTALVVVALYFPCRWFAKAKAERRQPWMSYL
jgi:uncharacterized membrane protein